MYAYTVLWFNNIVSRGVHANMIRVMGARAWSHADFETRHSRAHQLKIRYVTILYEETWIIFVV